MRYKEFRAWLKRQGVKPNGVNTRSSSVKKIERVLAHLGSPHSDLDDAFRSDQFAQIRSALDGLKEDAKRGGERFRFLLRESQNPLDRLPNFRSWLGQYGQFLRGESRGRSEGHDHGFEREHFELLAAWQGRPYDKSVPQEAYVYERLVEAYRATEAWANALKERLFPHGDVKIRKGPTTRAQTFWPYNWARIYPEPASPKALAYTVGIDAEDFVVKIDTVGNPPQRQQYEAIRGPSNHGSPFANCLPLAEGLEMTFEQFVDWSANAIANFEIGYDDLAQALGLTSTALKLVGDDEAARQGFADWRAALMDGAIRRDSIWWLPERAVVFKPFRNHGSSYHDGLELGVDPRGDSWAVQINEPKTAGDHNSGANLATDDSGKRYLVRQGLLQPNNTSDVLITGQDFVDRTGLTPVAVDAQGLAAKRQWFVVAALDEGAAEISRGTAFFVDRCAAARESYDNGTTSRPTPADRFGRPETGGTYVIGARAAVDERTVLREHGIVYLELAAMVKDHGGDVRKGRHGRGFEVDAEIETVTAKPLLIEIKTGISANEIHTGVGQLHLYRKLLTRLSGYEAALLLPRSPHPDVEKAVNDCQIIIFTYDFESLPDGVHRVTFCDALLERCGFAVGH